MKKTKSLWIYAAVLFLLAVALILTATLLQARLISSDGNIEVLGTFTKDAKQNIASLTEENVNLTSEINALREENENLKAAAEEAEKNYTNLDSLREDMASLYKAYRDDDFENLETLFEKVTKEDCEKFIPGLYERVRKEIAELDKTSKTAESR